MGALGGDQALGARHLTADPANRTVNPGDTVSFTITAAGSPVLTYQWRKGTSPLPGETGPALTLTVVTAANAGGYDVVVSNLAGSVTSAPAVLDVRTPPVISQHPDTRTVAYDFTTDPLAKGWFAK